MIGKFWMVYRMDGGSPRVRHETKELASAEAQRLATKELGHTFYVLETISLKVKMPARISGRKSAKASASTSSISPIAGR